MSFKNLYLPVLDPSLAVRMTLLAGGTAGAVFLFLLLFFANAGILTINPLQASAKRISFVKKRIFLSKNFVFMNKNSYFCQNIYC